MSRGRKPKAGAVRRNEPVELVPAGEAGVSKPASVAAVPNMSDLWDLFAGSGIAYKPEDAPLIEQMVFDLELARQCRSMSLDGDGRIRMMVPKGAPDPDTGEYLDWMPNPYIKQMREATAEALKIADQLGCTPLARARLGLTQAAGKVMTLSVADMIDSALARRK